MRRRGFERAQSGLAGLRGRGPLARHPTQVRLYDARGQARALEIHAEPGRSLVAHADEILRLAAEPPAAAGVQSVDPGA